jgi:hypothetical protein
LDFFYIHLYCRIYRNNLQKIGGPKCKIIFLYLELLLTHRELNGGSGPGLSCSGEAGARAGRAGRERERRGRAWANLAGREQSSAGLLIERGGGEKETPGEVKGRRWLLQ